MRRGLDRKSSIGRRQAIGRSAQWAVVAATLIGAAVGYLSVLHQFRVTQAPEEQEFGVSEAGEALVQSYIEPIALDALNIPFIKLR